MPPYETLVDARAFDNRLALLRWRILDYPSPAVLPPELTGVEPRTHPETSLSALSLL